MHPAPSCLPLAYIRHYGKRHCPRIYTVHFLFLPAFYEDCLQAGSKRATALADRKRRSEGGESTDGRPGGIQGGLLQPSLTNNDNLDNHTTTQPHRPASFRPSICAISTCRCAVPLREIPAFAVVGGGPRVIARAEPLGPLLAMSDCIVSYSRHWMLPIGCISVRYLLGPSQELDPNYLLGVLTRLSQSHVYGYTLTYHITVVDLTSF
ncbi:uncharacterized protein CLUP02_06445 [Colletotrichum lupini]|uniref:Uncharacterized protein n=1 Tax=Colletotrichum lupini TaxID=145971 RepID=A0A9Q8SP47_9PEZI|nr:uncharacterized protein CLUP02_06445 [Colletotrichum lupini]UQC80959.1 hypothetical protein CLUP02_06445 [Colletotrichum lupini]